MTHPAHLRRVGGRPETYDPRRRILVLVTGIVVVAVLLSIQLLRVQLLDPNRYLELGKEQRMRTQPLEGQRGLVTDRNGQELAVSLPQPVIVADPSLVVDPAGTARALAPLIGREVAELAGDLAGDGRFVYLQRPSDDATAERVRQLGLTGVFIDEEPRRFHPAGDGLARGVLGYVGVDNTGVSGLEQALEAELAGQPGQLISERGLNGYTIPEGTREIVPPVHGTDVRLTVDRAVQFEAERALTAHVEATGSLGGVVVITDPATGDILAMASVARADDGVVVSTSDNRAVTWTYEPASVMKAVTHSALIENGVATPDSTRVIPDELQIYDDVFTDDIPHEDLLLSLEEVLVRSSNTGTITWAAELGATRLHEGLTAFGFGRSTSLGFPGEASGLLADVKDWSGTSYATIAIGQGVAVTPLQMLLAYNVIANDGIYVAPRLVDATTGPDGTTRVVASEPTRRVISADTANKVTGMLTAVVDSGTAQRAAVPGYDLAAKTGTARKVQATGGYEDADGRYRYINTVAGFFPAEAPAYSMIVVLDEPQTADFASQTAAPLFGELAAWTLRHYQVSPPASVVLTNSGADTGAEQVAAPAPNGSAVVEGN